MDGNIGTIQERLRNPLRPLGVVVGALLVVATVAVFASAPWQIRTSMGTAIVQLLAALAMAGIGAGLAYISWAADE